MSNADDERAFLGAHRGSIWLRLDMLRGDIGRLGADLPEHERQRALLDATSALFELKWHINGVLRAAGADPLPDDEEATEEPEQTDPGPSALLASLETELLALSGETPESVKRVLALPVAELQRAVNLRAAALLKSAEGLALGDEKISAGQRATTLLRLATDLEPGPEKAN